MKSNLNFLYALIAVIAIQSISVKECSSNWDFLQDGDQVALVAPAKNVNRDIVAIASQKLRELGLEPVIYEIDAEAAPYRYYSHSDDKRKLFFEQALIDPNIKAIWALLGGFGSEKLVLQFEQQRFHLPPKPKPVLGFSDITQIHLLLIRSNWATLHAPLAALSEATYLLSQSPVNMNVKFEDVVSILKGQRGPVLNYQLSVLNNPAKDSLIDCTSIVGGNTSIIAENGGSSTSLVARGKIVFLEDTKEVAMRLERRFIALIRGGTFNGARAIMLGNQEIEGGDNMIVYRRLCDLLLSAGLRIPVVHSPDFGHGPNNHVLPLNTEASLKLQGDTAILNVAVNNLFQLENNL